MAGKMNISHEWQPPTDTIHPIYPDTHPDMTFYWCNQDVREHLPGGMESWLPVQHIPYDPETQEGDTSMPGPGNTVRRGDLFLCMMPKRLLGQRRAYFADEDQFRIGTIKKQMDAAAAVAKTQRRLRGLADDVGFGEKADHAPITTSEFDTAMEMLREAEGDVARAGFDPPPLTDDDES